MVRPYPTSMSSKNEEFELVLKTIWNHRRIFRKRKMSCTTYKKAHEIFTNSFMTIWISAWIFFLFFFVFVIQTLRFGQINQNLNTLLWICEKTATQDGLSGNCVICDQYCIGLQPSWRTNSSSEFNDVINSNCQLLLWQMNLVKIHYSKIFIKYIGLPHFH